MEEQVQNNTRGALTGVFIALLAAFISTVFFVGFTYMAYVQKKQLGPPQQVIVQVAAAIVTVGITQFLFRQVQGNRLQFKQGFLGGWMSSMILGMFIAFYYSIFSKKIGTTMPKAAFAMVLMLYNLLGIIISFIFAFIFKKD